MKYVGIVLATLLVAGAGYVWYSVQPQTLATSTLCNGTVELTSRVENPNPIELGPQYSIVVTRVQGSQRKVIFTIGALRPSLFASGEYRPLPINTSIPVVVIETPPKNSHGEAPSLINIFVDPSVISRADFDEVGACLKTNSQAINTMLSETPDVNGASFGQYPSRFGGLAYISFSDLVQLISSVNTDSPPNGGSGDYKMVNQVGVVIFGSSYEGDIFNGIYSKKDFEALGIFDPYPSKNSRDEDIYQYINRLQTELQAR